GMLGPRDDVATAFLWATVPVVIAYSALMIWLGRRALLRFQAQEGIQAGESFVPGARAVPRFVAEWLRCRPAQPLANLLRRELRLLRAWWPLALFSIAAWAFSAAFVLPLMSAGQRTAAADIIFGLTACFSVLLSVLAGALS